MDTGYFQNPRRFPKNAEGPFYTLGHRSYGDDLMDGKTGWCGDCLACEAPELEAPELLAALDDENSDTYFVRQPSTPDEIDKACMAARVCCVVALRYGGRDQTIISKLGNDPELCDYIIDDSGNLVVTLDEEGNLLPFAQRLIEIRHLEWRKQNRKWYQFWL